jgi:DNA-binding protein Fis
VKDQLHDLIAQLVERGVPFSAAVEEFEKRYIERVLERVQGNQSRAARLLGIHRNTLSRKIEAHKLAARNGDAPQPAKKPKKAAARR